MGLFASISSKLAESFRDIFQWFGALQRFRVAGRAPRPGFRDREIIYNAEDSDVAVEALFSIRGLSLRATDIRIVLRTLNRRRGCSFVARVAPAEVLPTASSTRAWFNVTLSGPQFPPLSSPHHRPAHRHRQQSLLTKISKVS